MGSSHSKLQPTRKLHSAPGQDGTQEVDKWSKLVEHLTCPVCADLYSDARSLPCGHSLCAKCLPRDFGKGGAGYLCPVCSRLYPAKPALRKNPVLSNTARALTSIRSSALEAPSTGRPPLRNAAAAATGVDSVCLVLEQVDLDEEPAPATPGRPQVSEPQRHAQQRAAALSDANRAPQPPVPDDRLCPQHSQQELTHYCGAELRMVCPLCIERDEHGGHSLPSISQLSLSCKESLDSILAGLMDLKEVTMVEVTEITELDESIKLEKEAVRERCQREFDAAIQYLTQQKGRQMEMIERRAREKEEAVSQRLQQVLRKLDDCNQAMEDLGGADQSDDFKFLKMVLEIFPSLECILRPPDKAQDIKEIKKDLAFAYHTPQLRTMADRRSASQDLGPEDNPEQ